MHSVPFYSILAMAFALHALPSLGEGQWQLISPEKDSVTIVVPTTATIVELHAAEGLGSILRKSTGAEVAITDCSAIAPDDHGLVFVGVSAPLVDRIGVEQVESLDEDEYEVLIDENNVYLFGNGVHGALNATADFARQNLGARWFTPIEGLVIQPMETVVLSPSSERRAPSFKYRFAPYRPRYDFDTYYWSGANTKWDDREHGTRILAQQADRQLTETNPFVSRAAMMPFVHTSFLYIPPVSTHGRHPFDWLENRDYFETNPEFFSVVNGERRPRQLDFTNTGLRQELTANYLEHIRRIREYGVVVARGRGLEVGPWDDNRLESEIIISVSAEDVPGSLCESDAAKEMEEIYQSRGGPILDYAIELAQLLQEDHPDVLVKIDAYRKSQTQHPPVLPEGVEFPSNILIKFAPVEDAFLGDWSHPDLAPSVEDLKGWAELVDNLWVWVYPNPYSAGVALPFANVRGLAYDLRKMHEIGVNGVFLEHGPASTVDAAASFTEIQNYIFFELTRDINSDVEVLIEEFTNHQYGPAAPFVRRYLSDLENARRSIESLPPWPITYNAPSYDDINFPYLTAANIHRWNGYFEEIDRLEIEDPLVRANIDRLRLTLDVAILYKWFELAAICSDTYADHKPVVARIEAANPVEMPRGTREIRPLPTPVEHFALLIEAGGITQPLPEQFADIDPLHIQRRVPQRIVGFGGIERVVRDPDSALGFAGPVHKPDYPFNAGFFQFHSRRDPVSGTHGPKLMLTKEDITPGDYQLFHLGEIEISRDSLVWFSAQSWQTSAQLGDLYVPDEDNLWDAWISMKFDGPSYGGEAEEDSVLVDQVILVRQSR